MTFGTELINRVWNPSWSRACVGVNMGRPSPGEGGSPGAVLPHGGSGLPAVGLGQRLLGRGFMALHQVGLRAPGLWRCSFHGAVLCAHIACTMILGTRGPDRIPSPLLLQKPWL